MIMSRKAGRPTKAYDAISKLAITVLMSIQARERPYMTKTRMHVLINCSIISVSSIFSIILHYNAALLLSFYTIIFHNPIFYIMAQVYSKKTE
jgi:hypothetical protein